MKLFAAIAVLFCINSVVAHARSCDGNRDSQSNVACDDRWVIHLDKQLDALIPQTRGLNISGTSPKEVSAWKDRIHDQCNEAECLYREYTRFLANVSDELVSRRPIRSDDVTAREQEKICSKVIALHESGKLDEYRQAMIPYSFLKRMKGLEDWKISTSEKTEIDRKLFNGEPNSILKVKLSNDAPPTRFGIFNTGGTCSSSNIYSLDLLSDAKTRHTLVDAVDDPGELIRWAYWGDGDTPYYIERRNLLIAGRQVVSVITPKGAIRPICLLEVSSSETQWIRRESPDVCDATVGNILSPIEWTPLSDDEMVSFSSDERAELSRYIALRETESTITRLDIDGNHSKEIVVFSITDSGAGCGSHREKLNLIASDGDDRYDLITFLSGLPNSKQELYAIADDYFIRAVDHDHRTSVYSLSGGKPKLVCESVQVDRLKVAKHFRPIHAH